MSKVNPDRVVNAFKVHKKDSYKKKNTPDAAFLKVARMFDITVADVKRMVYEAKPSSGGTTD